MAPRGMPGPTLIQKPIEKRRGQLRGDARGCEATPIRAGITCTQRSALHSDGRLRTRAYPFCADADADVFSSNRSIRAAGRLPECVSAEVVIRPCVRCQGPARPDATVARRATASAHEPLRRVPWAFTRPRFA